MNNNILASIAIGSIACGLSACNGTSNTEKDTARINFIETKFIDSSIKPSDDFYRYVNGKWLDTAKIPPDKTAIGGFNQLHDDTQLKLKDLLENAEKNSGKTGSIAQKVGDFYASGMDTATIDKRGYDPVKPILAKADAIKDLPSLLHYVAEEDKNGDRSIIGFGVGPDQKNSSINIAGLGQTGIGLPDRDYYFKNDPATVAIQNAYKKYLSTLFTLSGIDSATAAKNTDIIYNIEKQIASSHKTRVQMRDVSGNYNKVSVESIIKKQPNIGWAAYFNAIDAKVDSVDMGQPAYYDKLNQLLVSVPLNDWKIYLKANVLSNYAGLLSKPFRDAAFDYGKILSGQKVQKQRWEQMAGSVNGHLGEALGQLYIEKYFPPEAKKRIDELVSNLTKAFSNRIQKLDWMSDSTKAIAQDKLKAIVRNIGYPSKWRDYSKVNVDKATYFENVVSANKNDFDFQLSHLGKPVDKTLWYMTPPTINAYYDPTMNVIVFPAGILQYPFFDKDADDAVNYGGIGMVIGHEMTHGFDDQGSQYDKDGNIHNWWTKDDKEKFDAKVNQIQSLYSTFTMLDSLHVNGQLTTGENMADFGGVAIAYDAFKMTKQGNDTTKIDGFTPDQRFFISLAQIWRGKQTDERTRQLINLDPHSPAQWRVLGPLMNFDPFYKAFNVQPGDKMYREEKDRIRIW
ncbi:MAG: M13 family metallopeptidase [Arachidicoccus sp.]|nr:M13 family metallopeptidase [Arachidicoccus sp.]